MSSKEVVYPFHSPPNRFVYAVILAVLVFLALAAEATLISPSATRTMVMDYTYPLINLPVTYALLLAAQRSLASSRRLGWAWLILALAQLCYAVGNLAQVFIQVSLHRPQVPPLVEGTTLLYALLFTAGIYLVPSQAHTLEERLETGLDITITTLVAMLGLWNGLVEPWIRMSGGTPGAFLSRPLGDIALFAALLMLLYKVPTSQKREPLWFLGSSAAAMIVADILSSSQALYSATTDVGALAVAYGLSFLLAGLGAVLQIEWVEPDKHATHPSAPPGAVAGPWLAFFPYLWVPLAVILLFVGISNHLLLADRQVIVVGGMATCLVVLRQILILEKNRRLKHGLSQTAALIQQHAAALSEKDQVLKAIFTASPLAIHVIDPQGKVKVWSPMAERLFGWKAEEVVGKEPPNVPPQLKSETAAMTKAGLEGEGVKDKNTQRLTRSGQALDMALSTAPLFGGQGKTTGLVAILADITSRKKDEEKIRQFTLRNQVQGEIATLMAESGTQYQVVLDWVTRRLASLMGELSLIFLLPEGGDQFQLVSQHPDRPAAAAEIGQKLAALYWQKILVQRSLPGGTSSPAEETLFAETNLHRLAIHTLHTPERVLGALCIGRELAKSPFSSDDTAFLQDIAHWTAIALTKAQLAAKAQAQSEEVGLLLSLTSQVNEALATDQMFPILLNGMHKLIPFDAGIIVLISGQLKQSRVALADGFLAANSGLDFPMNETISLSVMQKQKTFVTANYASEPGRMTYFDHVEQMGPTAIAPLKTDVGVIGEVIICRERIKGAQAFNSDDVRLLSAVSNGLGSAIRRDQLLEEARERLNKVQTLHQIDLAITGSVDMRLSLGAILDQIMLQLKVDAADVLVLNPSSHMLAYAAGVGFRSRAVEHTQLHLGQGFAGIAALERRTLTVNNLIGRKTDYLRAPLLLLENFIYYSAVPLISKDQVKGVLEIFHRSSLKPEADWKEFLEALASQAAIAIDNTSLFADLHRSNTEMIHAYDATIESWARALDLREKEAEGHTVWVTQMTLILARALGINEADLIAVRRGALLHDIGKMGVPDDILFKTSALTPEEWELMKRHPLNAYEMLAPIDYLKEALDIPYNHHERWDGSGYPRGLKGAQIPLAARIFSVIDVWDALTSNRAYRKAWDEGKALEYIQSQAGKQFDPYVVEAFLRIQPWKAVGQK